MDILNFAKKLKSIVPKGSIELPPQPKFGDLAFNGIMIDKSKKEEILSFVKSIDFIKKYEIVGPGFLNMWFVDNIIIDNSSINTIGQEKIHIEYCSPNPTGDLHFGHARNTILGFCTANLFKLCGFQVTTEMYINDQGNQMNQFLETVQHYKFPNDNYQIFYKGEYVKDIANQFVNKELNRDSLVECLLGKIQSTLDLLNIKHDNIVCESSLHKEMHQVIEILKQKNLVYYGVLENQKVEGEQLILKTIELGFETDTVLQRPNGIFTYFAFDIAYHYNKLKRGFNNQICVLGEDHVGLMYKLQKILKEIFDINLTILKYNMVNLIEKNEVISMSKREGTILTIRDVLEKIDIDYLKWIIVSYNNNKVISFNIDNILKENPLFTIKYVNMRLNQIEIKSDKLNLDLNNIKRRLVFWPINLINSIDNMDVHKALSYIIELSNDLKIVFETTSSVNEYDYNILQECKKCIDFAIKLLNLSI